MRIQTVRELIDALSKFDPNAPVVATWEGVLASIGVYASLDGVVLIDADSNYYQGEWQNRSLKGRVVGLTMTEGHAES